MVVHLLNTTRVVDYMYFLQVPLVGRGTLTELAGSYSKRGADSSPFQQLIKACLFNRNKSFSCP